MKQTVLGGFVRRVVVLWALLSGFCAFGAGFYYDVNYDGTVTVTGYSGTVSANLSIPSTIDGMPVAAIGECAFADNETLRSVKLPESLRFIEMEAFDSCPNLESVTFSEGLISIGFDAFFGCESLGNVVIPSTVQSGINFTFCRAMTSVTVSDSNPYFMSIDGVVYSKDGTTLVWFPAGRTGEWTVPSHVGAIEEAAFGGGQLSSVRIGAGVWNIGQSPFYCNSRLTGISVDEANPYFKDVDGILFSKDGAQLIAYPAAKADIAVYTVPSTVTSLYEAAFSATSLEGVILPSTLTALPMEAFAQTSRLASVVIGRGVAQIGEVAFEDTTRLTRLTLPDTVGYIDEGAFEDCTRLRTLYVPAGVSESPYAYEDCPAQVVYYPSAPQVHFDLNYVGAPAYPYDRTVVSGQPVGLLMAPEREDMLFRGWFADPEGGEQISENTVIYSDTTYYAHWSSVAGVDFSYDINYDGTITLTGFSGELPENLVIPSTVDGMPVAAIGECAFADNETLRSVKLPESLRFIEMEAFDSCPNLESVTFSEGLISIGFDAFFGCESLGNVVIPSTVQSGINFTFCRAMTSVTVSDSNPYFMSIDGVVYSKDGTTLVWFPAGRTGEWTVPSHVGAIEEAAFGGGQLSSVRIGAGVWNIGQSPFYCNSRLTGISVDEANPYFKDVDGILFSKDGAQLIAYPAAKADIAVYTVPSTVTSLYEAAFSATSLEGVILPSTLTALPMEAFAQTSRLASVVIGRGVAQIGEVAFEDTTRLTRLTLPDTVGYIDEGAFEDCTRLRTLYVPAGVSESPYAYEDCPAQVVYYPSAPQVHFDLNYVGAPAYPYDRTVVSGQPVGLLMAPEREDMLFRGWFTAPEGGEQISENTIVYSETTYYAHWSDGTVFHTITWLNDDGSQLDETQVRQGEIPEHDAPVSTQPAEAPYRYEFAGWSPALTEADGDATYTATFRKVADLSQVVEDWTAADGDEITGTTTHTVTIPAGATVYVNGIAVAGAAGGGVAPEPPEFADGGKSATTSFVQGTNGKWTLTTFAELSNDALGADVPEDQIQVYAADSLEGLKNALPMAGGVVVKERKSAVMTTIEVSLPGNPDSQYFKVSFGK